jgi:uncharacterized protein with PQ loop repeat
VDAVELTLPVLAGAVSTTIFAASMLPMLAKAARSKDLSSYSLGNIVLANVGNAVHSVYVFHLPAGPVWVLHSFYLVSTVLMLVWYLRYESARGRVVGRNAHSHPPRRLGSSPEAVPALRS